MQSYQEMSREELLKEKESLEQQYKEICKKGLKLDMSRGKPSKEQLELSMPMMDVLTSKTPLVSRAGTDIRNYGVIDGITEGQEFIASLVGLGPEAYDNVIVYGNASLNIMYDCIARSMLFGVNGSTPWLPGRTPRIRTDRTFSSFPDRLPTTNHLCTTLIFFYS